MRDEQVRAFARVSCPCGAAVRIDPMSAERRFRCPRCSNLIDFVVSVDRATKRPKVSIVVPPDAVAGLGESLGASTRKREAPAPPPPSPPRAKSIVRGVFGTCICGAEFPVDDRELTTIQPCPDCGVRYHVVVKMDRATKERSAILVPVDGQTPPRPRVTAVPKATRATKRVRVTRAPAKPEIPPGAQAVVCPCGHTLVVRRRDVQQGKECEACGRSLRFKEEPDPQTLKPRIRVRPDPK